MDVCFDRRFTGRLFVVPGRLGAARTCGRRPDSKPTEGDAESCGQRHQRPAAEQHQFRGESRLPKSERVGYSARDTNWNLERLEPARSLDYADHLPASAERTGNSRNGRVRFGRYATDIFHFTQEAGKVDLGSWTGLPVAHSNKYVSGTGEARHRAIHRCPDATGPLDAGGAGKQCLVGGGFGQPSRCESVPDAVLPQLQPAKRLVHRAGTHHHRQLGSQPRQRVDCAVWWRRRKDHEVRGAAGEPPRSVLRQRCASREYSGLDHAAADFVPVSQVEQGTAGDADGEKTEAIRARATVGARTSAAQAAFPLQEPDLVDGNGQIISSDGVVVVSYCDRYPSLLSMTPIRALHVLAPARRRCANENIMNKRSERRKLPDELRREYDLSKLRAASAASTPHAIKRAPISCSCHRTCLSISLTSSPSIRPCAN